MAIEYDISGLLGKVENEGSTDKGRLTASEFNTLVSAVQEVQTKVENTTNLKGILYKGGPEKGGQLFNTITAEGYLEMTPTDPMGDLGIFVTSKPKSYIASDADCKVTFYVSSKITKNGQPASSEIPCTVNFYIDNGTGKSELVGTSSIYDFEYDVPGVTKELTFDFASQKIALAKGENIDNKLTIEVNNGYGKIIPEYVVVRVIDLSLTVENFDTKKVYTFNDKPQIRATVFGSDAEVFATVDGKNVLTAGKANKNVLTTFPTDIFDNANVNTHGTHTIRIWASVTKDVGNGETETISTNTLEYNYIYGSTSTNPIVMANIANKTPEQYTVFNVAYVAYKYSSTNTSVVDDVITSIYEYTTDESGNITLGRQLTSTKQTLTFDPVTNSTQSSAAISLFPVNVKKNPEQEDSEYEEVILIGNMAVVISIGDYQYIDTINILPSSIILSEVPGYAVRLSSAGRSNGKNDDVRIWESIGSNEDGTTLITNVTFDSNIEFEDTGSGWINDGDIYDPSDPNDKGNIALRLRKGRYCTLNYKPFEKNRTFNAQGNNGTGSGMTISIEFATRNALNQQASVISCLANDSLGNPRGFEILANKASIYSKDNTLYADFKEDTRIRLDFVIDGKQWPYPYDTVWTEDGGKGETVSKTETENEALAIIYVDGVYQALALIPEGDSYMQSGGGAPIRFGSDECDLDIYNIRIYNQALTPIQIVQNYAYDTPNVKNKLAIAARNQDVLTIDPQRPQKPNINIEGLRIARPELPFFYVEMDTEADPSEELPKDKKKWKLMKMTQYKNPTNSNSQVNGNSSFEIEYGVMRNQGTSSMTYPWPWRNWDWKTKDGDFPQGKGEYHLPTLDDPAAVVTKYWAQYRGMNNIDSASGKGNIRKITLKKDYASSEMCNNAITSEMFTDMANGIGDAIPGVLSFAQRFNGGKNSPYRLTFVAQPCFMFRKYSDSTKEGTAGKGYEALGMMNLIPNKNECAYLGFYGQYEWEKSRAQSWELADNYPEYFWKQEISGVTRLDNDGNYTNDIDGFYEARYPKDTTVFFKDGEADGDFGMVKPSTITPEQTLAVQNEQSDLVDFHNWLVSTNRQIPVEYAASHGGQYRPLEPEELTYSWNIVNGASVHTEDTPAYRLDKFKAEADEHIIVDQFALYYIWREMFWAYDSGFKNLQIYTMGPNPNTPESTVMQWGCMVRDADTTLGIQNQGRIEFLPYLEDTDYYTEVDGEKVWHFDALKTSYDESDITNLKGKHVLNGQLGSLWINIRDAFYDRLEEVYTKLHENSDFTYWTAGKAIKRFRDHQEKWCESLYNWGMRQYFGGSPFTKWINSGLGDKKNSRASWLQQAFNYRDAKYRVLSDYAAFRAGCYLTPDFDEGHTQNQPLKFKLYQPTYLSLGANKIDPKECLTHRRVTDVTNYIDVLPGDDLRFPIGANSAMGVQYGTNNMIEIGDFARVCKVYEVQSWQFPKLKSLLLGHEPERDGVTYREFDTEGKPVPISNDSMGSIDLSSLKQLQILDVTNHTKLGNFNASFCTELKELYASGCNSTQNITLPKTTTLETIYFPYSITAINFEALSGIKKFKLASPPAGASYSISNLKIVDCGDYMSRESYNVVVQVIDTLEKVYHPIERNDICTLSGVNWTDADSQYLEKLLNIEAKLSGYIKVKELSNDLKVRLIAAYGPIDDSNNSLHIEYNQREITGAKLPSKMYFHEAGQHQLKFTVTPPSANTYKSATWSITPNAYASFETDEDKANGVLTRNAEVANQSTSAKLTVTIKQLPYSNGDPRQDIVLESTVYFYERLAVPGDYVFQDGTYSDELDDSKTPIGVCFYVDPKNPENRLMMALESVPFINKTSEWGLGTGGNNTNNNVVTGYYGSPQGIVIEGESDYNCYDINNLPNINTPGVSSAAASNHFTDAEFRDPQAVDNNYFKSFGRSSYFGDLGWKPSDYRIYVDRLTGGDGRTSIVINAGDPIPAGYFNTMSIIQHRNKVLDNYSNEDAKEFIRPYADEYTTELESLRNLGNKAETLDIAGRDSSIAATGGSHLYYPAASVCFAYQPNASGLLDKFKAHNWFLPSSGELLRMCYYAYQSYKDGVAQETPVESIYDSSYNQPANAFYRAIKDEKLKMTDFYGGKADSGTQLWSSTETTGEKQAMAFSSNNGAWEQRSKSSTGIVRPVCRF